MLRFNEVENEHQQVGGHDYCEYGQEHVVPGLVPCHRLIPYAFVQDEAYVYGQEFKHSQVERYHIDKYSDEGENGYRIDDDRRVLALRRLFVAYPFHRHTHHELREKHCREICRESYYCVLYD